jgi:hypothetical protein
LMNLTDISFDKPVLEEHAVPERRGMLGGRSIETTAEGKLQKMTFAATCEECGLYPLDKFVMCVSCHRRLCTECSPKMNGVPYCRQHLIEVFPLSRNGYKALLCLETGIDDIGEIKDITKIPKDDVKASLAFLTERKLISTSGLSVFLKRKITADGLHALSVYRNVYGKEEDVAAVTTRLQEDGEEQSGE